MAIGLAMNNLIIGIVMFISIVIIVKLIHFIIMGMIELAVIVYDKIEDKRLGL